MGYALGGGSGWVLLTYVPRDGRLMNQYAAEHTQAVASGVPILALDMYEHAYHIDFGANAKAYADAFLRNVGCRIAGALRDAGFDAKYMTGGHHGWRAMGGPIRMKG